MVELTQADWNAAESYWDSLSDDWNPGRGISEEERLLTVQAFARHRIAAEQRGKLEGARLAIEAAATVAPSKTPSGECETVGQWTRRTLREAIRALDPAKIVGEG